MYQRILAPIDGSPTSDRGMTEALLLAKSLAAKVRLIHVVDQITPMSTMAGGMSGTDGVFDSMKDAGKEILANAVAVAERHNVAVETALLDNVSGSVSDVVAEEARSWGADLIVLGTHGRTGMERVLIGSDAELIVRDAPTPVLLVRVVES